MSVAIYCRVSSEDQKERCTIDNQIEILKTYAEMNKLSIVAEFLDDGVSGTIPLTDRPQGKELIKSAEKGIFDTVVVWKVDRFGRDTLSGLSAAKILNDLNIKILSVTEPFDLNTPSGKFQFTTYLSMAELERNNILDRMFIGATRAAKQGKWLGGIVPYGYELDENHFLKVYEPEATIIQEIFDMYTEEGMSSLAIAVKLNALNIPSSCGSGKGKRKKGVTGKWRAASIQRILSNTTYYGVHTYGKRATRRTEVIERQVPSIISKEQWDKAQRTKKDNSIMSKRNINKRDWLLRKLIKCPRCGKMFYGVSYKDSRAASYVCSGKRGDNKRVFGIKCDNVNVNADYIEEHVWSDCEHIIRHYEEYIEKLKMNDNHKHDNDIQDELDKINKTLQGSNAEKNRILTLYRKSLINDSELEEQLKDIKHQESKLNDLKAITEDKINKLKNQDVLISDMAAKMKMYNDRIDKLTFEDKTDIVRMLVKEITVEPLIEGGQRVPDINVVYNLVKLEPRTDINS